MQRALQNQEPELSVNDFKGGSSIPGDAREPRMK
jgi:hypothetical protein